MPESDPPRKKRQFHRPEKTVEFCYRGDLVAEIEDLERQVREVRTNAQTLGDRGQVARLGQQIEALREQMRTESEVWRLRGIPGDQWTSMVLAHPVRDDDQVDKAYGFNTETFWPAAVLACLVSPEIAEDELLELWAEMPSYQRDEIKDAVLAVNRRRVDIPFSFVSSTATSTSDETSRPQSD